MNMEGINLSEVEARFAEMIWERGNHLWKPIGFALLTVLWFNPIIWLAYILLCKDIEIACDEKVISGISNEYKKEYSETLLSCSAYRKFVTACPLAIGEVGVKERIKSVMGYKKTTFWIALCSFSRSPKATTNLGWAGGEMRGESETSTSDGAAVRNNRNEHGKD